MTTIALTKSAHLSRDLLWILGGCLFLTLSSEIRIPLPWTPVPITLQTFMVVLLGLTLPLRQAVGAVGLYIILGAVGVPVFSGWTAGLLRPTTGYLIGFLLSASVLSLGRGWFLRGPVWRGIALTYVVADLTICGLGMLWLHYWTGTAWSQLLMAGYLPFIPGGIVKTSAAWLIAKRWNKNSPPL